MKFVVTGRPVAAVRMTQRSKYKDPSAQRYLAYKDRIGWAARIAGANASASSFKLQAVAYIKGRDMDVDNLAKSLMDGLNKVAWNDDRQVVELTIRKVYVATEDEQKIEVELQEIAS